MHDDPSRTTPLGFARYSYEYLEAAQVVDEEIGSRPGFEMVPPIPVLYLVGHAIELSLKAFLLKNEISLQQLRSPRHYGHNLKTCFHKAQQLGLLSHVQFTGHEVGAFEILDNLYSTKQLEYIVTGEKFFPSFGPLHLFAVKLFNAVAKVVGFEKNNSLDMSTLILTNCSASLMNWLKVWMPAA